MKFLIPSVLLALALVGCAPTMSTVTEVRPSVVQSAASFYPYESGLAWSYVPQDETSAATPYVLRGEGPTIFLDQSVQAMKLTGRGADQTWYRQIDASGVRLLGFRKPGMTVALKPAWREYPSQNAWQIGLTWQGESAITVASDDGKVQAQGTLKYRYVVQDRRQVKVPAGTFDVWVVTRQITDDIGGLFPATQQLWFAPFVGEVMTPEELVMTGRNFAAKGK